MRSIRSLFYLAISFTLLLYAVPGQASKGESTREKGEKRGDFTDYGSKHKAKIISPSVIQERIRKCTIYYNEYSAKRVAHIHLTNTH